MDSTSLLGRGLFPLESTKQAPRYFPRAVGKGGRSAGGAVELGGFFVGSCSGGGRLVVVRIAVSAFLLSCFALRVRRRMFS